MVPPAILGFLIIISKGDMKMGQQKKKKIFIYHHNDTDGRASAAVMAEYFKVDFDRRRLGKPEFIFREVDYTMQFSMTDFDLDTGDEYADRVYAVCFLDYSFSKTSNIDFMKELPYSVTDNIIWIDHHKTSLDVEQELRADFNLNRCLQSIIDTKWCATMLCYEYAVDHLYSPTHESHMEGNTPLLIKYVDSFDTWKLNQHCTKEWHLGIQARLASQPLNAFLSNVYGIKYAFFNKDYGNNNKLNEQKFIDKMISEGKLISQYKDMCNKQLIDGSAFTFTIEDYAADPATKLHCLAVNTDQFGSDIFGKDFYAYDMVVRFSLHRNQWVYSLYSYNETVPCDYYAKVLGGINKFGGFGGGGHKNAAGFQTNKQILGDNCRVIITKTILTGEYRVAVK